MEKILFINSCYNLDKSRTMYLSNKIFEKFNVNDNYDFEEIRLKDLHLVPLSEEKVNTRKDLHSKDLYDVDSLIYSKKILSADIIVVSAPLYDYSYPSMLKVFMENVSIPKLMYKYDKNGVVGNARGRKFIYITSRGGSISDDKDYGYLNLCEMFKLFGIKESTIISINNIDFSHDPIKDIDELVKNIKDPFK